MLDRGRRFVPWGVNHAVPAGLLGDVERVIGLGQKLCARDSPAGTQGCADTERCRNGSASDQAGFCREGLSEAVCGREHFVKAVTLEHHHEFIAANAEQDRRG